MIHVAIMKKSWHLIEKILSGEKTIESRWYQTRRAPWNKVSAGDLIYFKNSGEKIIACAKVNKVLQFELKNKLEVSSVIDKYGKNICLVNVNINQWKSIPKYVVLMYLSNAKLVKPFSINKTGFGSACAWLCIKDNPNKNKKIKIDMK